MAPNHGRNFSVYVSILLLAGCAAGGPSISTPVRPGPAIAAPAYRSGDQWTYRVVRQTGKNEQVVISYRNGKFESDNPEIFDGTIWANVYHADSKLKPLN